MCHGDGTKHVNPCFLQKQILISETYDCKVKYVAVDNNFGGDVLSHFHLNSGTTNNEAVDDEF